MKKSFIIFLVMFSSFSCKEDPVSPSHTPVFSNDLFTVDTLQITVGYDDTPGFLSPATYHDFYIVTRLAKRGIVGGYAYSCGTTKFTIGIDGVTSEPDTPHRFHRRIWGKNSAVPGTVLSYSLNVGAYFETEPYSDITLNGSVTVQKSRVAPREEGATQCSTGTQSSYDPVLSKDGTWLFFQTKVNNTRYTIWRMPTSGGTPEEIFSSSSFVSYALIRSGSYILIIPDVYNTKSKLITISLTTGYRDSVVTNGYLWGAPAEEIPGTNRIVTLTDPNESPIHALAIVTVDYNTGQIDTIASSNTPFGSYDNVQVRPQTKEISYTTYSPVGDLSLDVHSYNTETKTFSIPLSGIRGFVFRWAPNGTDFAVIRRIEYDDDAGNTVSNTFLVRGGSEQQVTTYPGDDRKVCFSPIGNSLAVQTERRGTVQIWKVPF